MKTITLLIISLSTISWSSDFKHNISADSKFLTAFLNCVYNEKILVAEGSNKERLIAKCLHRKKVPSSALNPISKQPLSNESINMVITHLEILEK